MRACEEDALTRMSVPVDLGADYNVLGGSGGNYRPPIELPFHPQRNPIRLTLKPELVPFVCLSNFRLNIMVELHEREDLAHSPPAILPEKLSVNMSPIPTRPLYRRGKLLLVFIDTLRANLSPYHEEGPVKLPQVKLSWPNENRANWFPNPGEMLKVHCHAFEGRAFWEEGEGPAEAGPTDDV